MFSGNYKKETKVFISTLFVFSMVFSPILPVGIAFANEYLMVDNSDNQSSDDLSEPKILQSFAGTNDTTLSSDSSLESEQNLEQKQDQNSENFSTQLTTTLSANVVVDIVPLTTTLPVCTTPNSLGGDTNTAIGTSADKTLQAIINDAG